MKLKYGLWAVIATTAIVTSCAEDDAPFSEANTPTENNTTYARSRANGNQALQIANIFSNTRGFAEESTRNKTAKLAELTSTSCYVDHGDTLLYAFNYGDSEGYIVIGSNLSMFPIVAQSDTGNIDLEQVDKESPFFYFIEKTASIVNESLNLSPDTSATSFWKDVDNDNFIYTVEVGTDLAESTNKTRSSHSTGWEHIFPSTGYQINGRWSQNGDYSYAAKNGAYIGCPAVAIGMLLYDVRLRDTGSNMDTWPQFTYSDIRNSKAKTVSSKFRKIADMIPNYRWGSGAGMSSGAKGTDIVNGLKALGFPNATIDHFDLPTAYKEMCYTETDSKTGMASTRHRGILLCGISDYGSGHIWFCDGYQEVKYQVTKRRKLTGRVVSRRTEYESQLFMNWGQGSGENGYFAVNGNTGLSSDCAYHNNVMMITGLKKYNKIHK